MLALARCRRRLFRDNHFMQVSSRLLNVEMFILSCSTFRGNYGTAMDVHEVSVGEFISFFNLLRFRIIDPKVPFCIFTKSVLLDELVLLLSGRLIFTPR